eukprot:scaffold96136_cov37-Tisochrysis_lutea.AAC.1
MEEMIEASLRVLYSTHAGTEASWTPSTKARRACHPHRAEQKKSNKGEHSNGPTRATCIRLARVELIELLCVDILGCQKREKCSKRVESESSDEQIHSRHIPHTTDLRPVTRATRSAGHKGDGCPKIPAA